MAHLNTACLFSLCYLLMLQATWCLDTPVVSTSLGKIVGERVTVGGATLDRFLGIPYAKAPVGRLRFKNPVNHPGWGEEVRQANQFGPHCPQLRERLAFQVNFGRTITNLTLSEDCLFMNIYVPRGVDVLRQTRASLAIVVNMHPGGFIEGSGATFSGDIVAQEGDIVFVTFNYRLGFLGFYSTGTSYARGNYGLFDQHFAIKWVRDNARAFGGDPDRITISGGSAGAASVEFHMLSPLSKGLFQGGISASGSALAPWALTDSLSLSQDYATRAGCGSKNTWATLRCLRGKDAMELAEITGQGIQSVLNWQPTIDGVFIPKHPRDLLRENVTSGLRYMVGSTSDDGSIYSIPFAGDPPTVAKQQALAETFKADSFYWSKSAAAAFARSVNHEYGLLKDPMPPAEVLIRATRRDTDVLFAMPAEQSARLHAAGGAATYKYKITLRLGYPPSYLPKAPFVRAEHFDTAVIYYGVLEQHPEIYQLTEAELEAGRMLRRYVSNFVKNGDPNVGAAVSVPWPQYTTTSKLFMNLDAPITIETFNRERQYLFATEVLPAINKVGTEASKSATRAPKVRPCWKIPRRVYQIPRYLKRPFNRRRLRFWA